MGDAGSLLQPTKDVKAAPEAFPQGTGPIYLIDPRGNLVLWYPEDPDIKGIANDLIRLLKASQIG